MELSHRVAVEAGKLEQKVRELTQVMQEDNGSKWLTTELRSHVIHYQIDKYFPGHVAKVEVERHVDRNVDVVRVRFKNEHSVCADMGEFMSKEFIALCSMTYQLPHRSTYDAE